MRGIDEWVHFSNAFLINILVLLSRPFFFFFFFIYLIFEISVGIHVQSALGGNSKYSVISEHVVWTHFLLYFYFKFFYLKLLISQHRKKQLVKLTNA